MDKKYTRAIRWYRKAAKLHATFWHWRTIAWLEYTRLKQYSQAVRSYQHALKLVKKNRDRADLYLNLGRLHLRWKKPTQALKYLQNGIKIKSNRSIKSAILWEIGSVYSRIDKHKTRAIRYYEQSAQTKPYAWRWYSIGATYQWHLKKRDAAIHAYKKALLYYKKKKLKAMAWIAIGRCYMDNDKHTAAKSAFNRAINLDRKGKRGAEALFWMGYLYGEKLMDETKARQLVQKAIRLGYTTNFARKKLRQYNR